MSENPYAPPTAAVADVESGVPLERPRPVKTALILAWISLVLALPFFASEMLEGPDPDDHDTPDGLFFAFMGFFSAAIFALAVWVIVSIGRARNWARVFYVVLTAFGVISLGLSPPEFTVTPWYWGAVDLLTVLMDIAVVVLLYRPASNAWFRVRGRRPAAPAA